MTKLDILRLDSTTENDTAATLNINTNFENIQKAIENTLSRDGTTPNYMDADLDMNSYRIINVGEAVNDTDAVSYKQFKEEIGEASIAASQAAASAAQAASSAQSALVSSTNAINSVRGAENVLSYAQNLLSETQEYVDNAKVDINGVVETGKQDINSTIDDASMRLSDTIEESVEEVKTAALEAAQGAINDAAAEATAIVIDYANNEIKPLLNEIASNAAESAENASESAGLAASESGNAAISATDSQHYAEDSRIWAEGSDSEVKNVDGEHSSKVWSEIAKTSATSASSSAELAKQYGNDKINQTHITNCITEIPQDIKLEIDSSGKCWLKAGSKCYKPNGTVINIVNDIAVGRTTTGQEFIGVSADGSRVALYVQPSRCYSGTTAPTGFSGYGLWLDTNSMTYKYSIDGGSTWTTGDYSLPIALVTMKNVAGEVTSIDQVFNGFGYIGSTVFALPGVKGLIPNGRNADGSLKNTEFETDRVLTITGTGSNKGVGLYLRSNEIQFYGRVYKMFKSLSNVPNTFNGIGFITDDNLLYTFGSGVVQNSQLYCVGGVYDWTSNTITSLTPKHPFRAVDQNDFNKLDEEAVKTSGNQTIGGVKTFNNGTAAIKVSRGNATYGEIMFTKNDGTRTGGVRNIQEPQGNTTQIYVTSDDGTSIKGSIGLFFDGTTAKTAAPTPPTSDNSSQIATTAWFRNNMQVVSSLPSSPTAGVFYFVKE